MPTTIALCLTLLSLDAGRSRQQSPFTFPDVAVCATFLTGCLSESKNCLDGVDLILSDHSVSLVLRRSTRCRCIYRQLFVVYTLSVRADDSLREATKSTKHGCRVMAYMDGHCRRPPTFVRKHERSTPNCSSSRAEKDRRCGPSQSLSCFCKPVLPKRQVHYVY